jgi:hypothetical protein
MKIHDTINHSILAQHVVARDEAEQLFGERIEIHDASMVLHIDFSTDTSRS